MTRKEFEVYRKGLVRKWLEAIRIRRAQILEFSYTEWEQDLSEEM